MDWIDVARVGTDTGTLVLIWLVQLVIYPALCYYQSTDLIRYHPFYTVNVSKVIVPLLVVQLGLIGWSVLFRGDLYDWLSLAIAGMLWLHTFIYFVPAHDRITKNAMRNNELVDIIKENWWRTAMWSALFLVTLTKTLVTYSS